MTSIKEGYENGGNSHNVYKRDRMLKDFAKSIRKRDHSKDKQPIYSFKPVIVSFKFANISLIV